MKNQYFGDIGDFGKYGLLRYFAITGISIGVNWYLTQDDETGDGKMKDYLAEKETIFSPLDEELFRTLKKHVIDNDNRNVAVAEACNLIEGATYYDRLLDISKYSSSNEKRYERTDWHLSGLCALKGKELVFLDPDNGLLDQKVSGKKNSVKYALTCEAADYYNAGHNIVYYCHKGRRKENPWREYLRILKNGTSKDSFADAELIALTYHRGVQRSYVFAIHPKDYYKYRSIIDGFLSSSWKAHFEEELIDGREL